MNIFERVKAAVTVEQAARRYGLKMNRNYMTCCLFHNDRHPSMKINEDYFYCFGCGASGDVVDLTARLFGLTKYEAAQKLADDFNIDPDQPPTAAALREPKRRVIKAFREDEIYCQRILCDYLRVLEDWKVRYAPPGPDAEWDDRFTEACRMMDYIEYLADLLTFGGTKERIDVSAALMKDGLIAKLDECLHRLREEEGDKNDRKAA